MSLTPNEKDLLAKKSDLEGILKPDANDILHLPDITISLAESQQGYTTSSLSKDGLVFAGAGTITGITSSDGNSTTLAASQSAVSAKQDKLIVGSNITIAQDGKTISATDTNEIEDLQDVDITNLANGQILKYNSTSQKWENGNESGGAGADEMTLDEYNALTTSQKNDGTIRFIPENSSSGTATAVDMSNIGASYNQSSMSITATSSTKTTITFSGGTTIGCNFNYLNPIDVTNISAITFKATNGSCYGGGAQAQRSNWNLQIGLTSTAIGDQALDITAGDARWAVVADMPLANHTYEETLDVSQLTGNYYLLVVAHGWNTVVEDVTLHTGGAYPSQIKYMSKTYADGSGGGGSSTLAGLSDVDITSPSAGQGLVYDATNQEWVNGNVSTSSSIDTLTDVNLTNLSNGQILKYNSTSQEWENANESGGGGSSALSDLTDVTVTSPSDGQVLTYDNTSGKWINDTPTASSSISTLTDVNLTSLSDGQILKYDATNDEWVNADESGGGGGTSSGLVELAKYTGAGAGYAAGDTITLSDNINNYDVLMFASNYEDKTSGFENALVTVNDFKTKYSTTFYAVYNPAAYADVKYLTDTTISVLRTNRAFVNAVYGMKLGFGGSSNCIDTLWTGLVYPTSQPETVTLFHPYDDYDYIIITSYALYSNVNFYTTDVFYDLKLNERNMGALNAEVYNCVSCIPLSSTSLQFPYYGSYGRNTHITGVYGVKLGGGEGSSEVTYSTTEHKVGTWIDGSEVYEKVISISNVSISSASHETVDTITGLDTIISCNGYVVEGNLKYTLNDITLRVIQDGTSVKLYSPAGTTWTISSGAIIIRYTKASS